MRTPAIVAALLVSTPVFANDMTSKIYVRKSVMDIGYASVQDWCMGAGSALAYDDEEEVTGALADGLYECDGQFYVNQTLIVPLTKPVCTPADEDRLNGFCL
jgi:hypothetical protein